MIKYSLFTIFLIPMVAFSQNRAKLEDFQKQSQTAKMGCYIITNPKSASAFMDFKLNSLAETGFQPKTSEKDSTGNEICARETKDRFAYYKNGYFRYVNRDVEPFDEGNQVDTGEMKKTAIEIRDQFVPADKEYKLISKNETFIMKNPSPIRNLAYVSYRFVRVLKNRLVLGLTDEIEITLGAGGKLREFRSFEPEYEPFTANTRAVVKPVAYEKLFKSKLKKKDFTDIEGKQLDFEQVNIDGVTDAYCAITDAGERVIVPHIAVLMSYNKNNEKISQETFLSLRAEEWSNLSGADVEIVNRSNK